MPPKAEPKTLTTVNDLLGEAEEIAAEKGEKVLTANEVAKPPPVQKPPQAL